MRRVHHALWLVLLSGCSGQVDAPYVVLQSDIQEFWTWDAVELPASALGETHLDAARTVYLNDWPRRGETQWPVGSVLIKAEQPSDDRSTWRVVGMSMRGGRFNESGSLGWEFIGIEVNETDDVLLDWRGFNAPDGSEYADAGLDDCNACHGASEQAVLGISSADR